MAAIARSPDWQTPRFEFGAGTRQGISPSQNRKDKAVADEEPTGEQPPRSLHHRIYPYMDEMVQYATERGDDLTDPEARPWIVRDRSTALRNERQGRGRALVRVWVPSDWTYVNDDE